MNMNEEKIRAIQNTIEVYKHKKRQAHDINICFHYQKIIDELTEELKKLLPDFTTENKKESQ